MSKLIQTIRTDKLCKFYGGRQVVDNVSVRVSQGEIVGLLGPNGAGKTTTFYMIVGMVRADKGHIFLDDLEVTEKPMYQRARLGIGYLPQEASIFRKLSVEDNIMAILETRNLKRSERKERLEQLLEEFKITHIRPPGHSLAREVLLMKTCMITFRSVTPAQRGEGVLRRAGIDCMVTRTSGWMEEQGCGYALKLWSNDIVPVVKLLRENKIQLRKVYIQLEDGHMEEVKL
jgi:ABC-type glutathione transport system ATPase component